ncbi:MAG: dockerin type I repeat-containing protein [Ruminococcus sp.]|nr:dockerin type I repeat-containing protein [Ruminococcus sp.]
MKKFINTALCLAVIAGAIPMGASAKSEPIFIENGPEHWEHTSISGDINGDGKVSVADAVIFQQCLMNSYSPDDDFELDKSKLDINFDGVFDAFDMVLMRKFVLNPEIASTQTWAIDAFASDTTFSTPTEYEDFNKIFTSYDEMSDYLSTIMTNNDEIQQFLDRYDETFFEENNLILEPFVQNAGDGVFYEIVAAARGKDEIFKDKIFNGIAFVLNSHYEHNEGLYPQKKTNLLAQVAVPKSQSSADDMIFYLDSAHFFFSDTPDSCRYTDGNHELVLINNWGFHHHSTDVYLKNPDGSFTYIDDMFDFDFENNGELSGENYNISFLDDCFIIDYFTKGQWHKMQSSYDGEEVINSNSYETPMYKSLDGQTELYLNSKYHYSENGEDITRETLIDIYLEETDGHLKHIGNLTAAGYNMPFKEAGEWSVDSDGNSVFSNGTTYSITWLEDSIMVDYQVDGDCWGTCTVSFDSSATEKTYYWK